MTTERLVAFRDSTEIIKKIDQISRRRGYNRSAFIRQALREKLAKTE
ncbi:MAG: ribbon-helix-helix domain-containing protein [Candidatus Bathyarchaeota archaeon]|nr:ribbon-helix-helix domain-containing protein [Candidatus Bathyarchaeota archaeon]